MAFPFPFTSLEYSALPSSRRTFLQQASAVSLLYGTSHATRSFGQMHMAPPNAPGANAPMLRTLQLPPFVDPLPIPETLRPTLTNGKRHLTISMQENHAKVHRDVPATRIWTYGPGPLAPLIEARSGEPLDIEWVNNLPTKHFLPIDHSLHGCGTDVPEVRATVHLHGARTRSQDDGYPEDWYVPGKSRTCHYPMDQEATALWYHDHAMGINRLNTYAGLFGMLLIRDKVEDSLHLPSGKYEIPLIFYDRNFTADGQLYYATSGDPDHPWIPEFSADGLLINGKIRPYLEVEPRLYRFRVLNPANSRFYHLNLSDNYGITQIGTDQGFLPAPVQVQSFTVAPAERADILIDFTHAAGKTLHLSNGAIDLMEIRVAPNAAQPASYSIPPRIPQTIRPIPRTPESSAIQTRTITLHDYLDQYEHSVMMLINRKRWHEPTTEKPKLNTTEIWEFVNSTQDTHPMHLHLVRFQILDRRTFDTSDFFLKKGKITFLTPAEPPAPNELGWKDTIQCPPGMVTRIIVRFEGYPGKYLYHCHILEHEANDMMRPFEVIA